jgi:murein biosynthesis integral membrane protein MurJ
MTSPVSPLPSASPPPPPAGPLRPGGVARAAILIACITVLARLAGFARLIVFTRSVGPSCLGDAYFTANMIPNIVFDIVVGGALTSLVVPVLAGPAAAGDQTVVNRTTSALLTWAATILIPVAILGAVFARVLIRLLIGSGQTGCSSDAQVAVGARMLEVFMPQVLLYGGAVILIGVLQSHRRFVGPAIGPLLSSMVVIAAYALFGSVANHRETALSISRAGQQALTRPHELILSVGTTLGVAALLVAVLVPASRSGLSLRPTYRFPPGVGSTIRAMAIAGALVVGSQDLATGVVLRLSNDRGADGAVVLYGLAWTVFTVPWAVLAVPLATSAFPGLTSSWQAGDRVAYAASVARGARVLVVASAAAAAMMVATAGPVAQVIVRGAPGGVPPTQLARALVTFAPGLIGYSMVALMSRAMYAQGNARTPAVAVVTGWLIATVASVGLAQAWPPSWTVAAIGVGTAIGVSVSGGWLVIAVRRSAGREALAGLPPATVAALTGGLLGGVAGALLALAAPSGGLVSDLVVIAAAAALALGIVSLAVAMIDRPTFALVLARTRLRRA